MWLLHYHNDRILFHWIHCFCLHLLTIIHYVARDTGIWVSVWIQVLNSLHCGVISGLTPDEALFGEMLGLVLTTLCAIFLRYTTCLRRMKVNMVHDQAYDNKPFVFLLYDYCHESHILWQYHSCFDNIVYTCIIWSKSGKVLKIIKSTFLKVKESKTNKKLNKKPGRGEVRI